MTKYLVTTSHYTNYAITCIINGTTNRRSFDNCFENGADISNQVVRNIMFKALNPPTKVELEPGKAFTLNSPEYRAVKKYDRWLRLVANLKSQGFWNGWLYFYTYGKYDKYISTDK